MNDTPKDLTPREAELKELIKAQGTKPDGTPDIDKIMDIFKMETEGIKQQAEKQVKAQYGIRNTGDNANNDKADPAVEKLVIDLTGCEPKDKTDETIQKAKAQAEAMLYDYLQINQTDLLRTLQKISTAIINRLPETIGEVANNYIDRQIELAHIEYKATKQDDKNSFHTNLFCNTNIIFEPSTLNLIAARPGRGKTTALISLAHEALIGGRQVLFLTAEETTEQILNRFIRCDAYVMEGKRDDFIGKDTPQKILKNYLKYYYLLKQGKIREGERIEGIENIDSIKTLFKEATDRILNYMTTGKLLIVSTTDPNNVADPTLIADKLQNQPRNSLVFIDYMQKLPTDNQAYNGTRYQQIGEVSETICKIAKNKELICIAGAQFNREKSDTKNSNTEAKPMSYNDLRECGNLENDASVIIGIDMYKNDDTHHYYYQLLKNRMGELDDKLYRIGELKGDNSVDNMLAYSYIQAIADPESKDGKPEVIREEKETRGGGKGNTERQEKQKRSNPMDIIRQNAIRRQ